MAEEWHRLLSGFNIGVAARAESSTNKKDGRPTPPSRAWTGDSRSGDLGGEDEGLSCTTHHPHQGRMRVKGSQAG